MKRLPSINQLLAILALVCVVPAAALFLAALAWSYQSQRAELTQNTIATARALMFGVDERLHSVELGLANLSQSRALAEGDLVRFHEEALALARAMPVRSITLVDAHGHQLASAHTRLEGLDAQAVQPQAAELAEADMPRVLDLFRTPLEKRYMTGVALAVRIAGRDADVLIASLDPADLQAMLVRERLSPTWIAAVLDSRGVIVARTLEHDRFVGTPARAALVARINEVPEDAVESVTVDGVPVITAFSRSRSSGWSIVIGVPKADITAQLRRTLSLFGVVSVLVLLATLAVSRVFAKRIAGSVRDLAAEARTVGHGEVNVPPVAFEEAEQLAQALRHAGVAMHDAQEGRARAEALLESVGDAMPVAVVAVGEDERIILFNKAAQRMFRVGPDDVLGLSMRRLFPRPTGEPFLPPGRQGAQPLVLRALRWEGDPFMVEAHVTAAGEEAAALYVLALRETTADASA